MKKLVLHGIGIDSKKLTNTLISWRGWDTQKGGPVLSIITRITIKWVAGAAAAVAVMSLASAAGAVTLSTGAGLLGGAEPNWALTSSPGSTSLTIVSGAENYPGVWVAAPGGSNWITPYAGGGTTATGDALVGEYHYTLNFGNPGVDVPILWSSDNGAEFYLNGSLLSSVNDTGYGSLVSFLIPAAAFSANNLFEVIVQNIACDCANPTGLLVSTAISAPSVPSVPLPPALPLFASGMGALGLLGWRRKRKAKLAA